jgi:hypothetical protein
MTLVDQLIFGLVPLAVAGLFLASIFFINFLDETTQKRAEHKRRERLRKQFVAQVRNAMTNGEKL